MKLFFLLGPGGVGKTTISAALGLSLSRIGKTLVITIDPAKRLKSALKIQIDEVKKVKDNLWATQVDKKKEFNQFARRYGIEELTRTKLYEIAAGMLPSDEYSAFIKIIEIYENGDFDFVVVDTPPSTKFIYFVDAPHKIMNMLETNAIRYMIEISAQAGKRLSGPLSLAGKILGDSFVIEFAKFLGNLKKIFSEMQEISKKANMILNMKDTELIAITSPYNGKSQELIMMIKEIEKRGLKVSRIIINRFLSFQKNSIPDNVPQKVKDLHKELVALSENMKEDISELRKIAPIFVIEEFFKDIASLETLEEFEKHANLEHLYKWVKSRENPKGHD